MWIGVVTLFPEMFEAISRYGITSRAIAGGLVELSLWNPRTFTTDRHATVDDRPFGGGPGMLMKVEPLARAIAAATTARQPHVVYLSPQGRPARHADIERLAALPELLLVAGRYEGIDERLVRSAIDEELAVGEFVVSGGELPAMMLIDALIRLQPGALGDAESAQRESFVAGLLDFPQYTRPREVDGLVVPEVLLSGNHEAIRRWRLQQSLGRTAERRPDLLAARGMNDEEAQLLAEYRAQFREQTIGYGLGHEEDNHG